MSAQIAVIGMACRFPGGDGVDAFWQALLRGDDAITPVPDDRWAAGRYAADASLEASAAAAVDHGGFIGDIRAFDAAFFGISESEATFLCPQQRLLLETAWHALEHAGVVPSSLAGTDTGVFVGLCGHDFSIAQWPHHDSLYLGTGTSNSVAANRISYLLGVHGPSFAVDAACSSSLVAVHLACRSLRDGECSLALAGSSNVLLLPEVTASLGRGGLISRDARCKSFGEGASGYIRSEGAGMVLLKRLDAAQRDGDRILGVIAGTAINHNGRSNGLTAPNPVAQARLIRRCLDESGVSAARIDYVEAAATGTRLGDAIEIKSLKDSIVAARGVDAAPLVVGSAKSNLGHLEATGGIAALIKTLLSIGHGRIPASLHSETLNPLCQIDPRSIHVAQRTLEWTRAPAERTAAINSFGFGGSNAHVIVQGVAPRTAVARGEPAPRFLPVSARSAAALAATIERLVAAQDDGGDFDALSLSASAARHREHHAFRAGVVFEDRAGLVAGLREADAHRATTATATPAIVLRGALDGCVERVRALVAQNAAFAAVVSATGGDVLAKWLRSGDAEPGARLELQLALDYCLARWLEAVLPAKKLYLAEGAGEVAAAMAVLDIPLRDAPAIHAGAHDFSPWRSRLRKRLPIRVTRATREYTWRGALADREPAGAVRIDPAALECPPNRFAAELLRALYLAGAAIDWQVIHPTGSYDLRDLPSYPFQRERYWPEADSARVTPGDGPDLGLVGAPVALPLSTERRYEFRFDPARSALLADHRVDGHVILSAAAQILLCAAALRSEHGDRAAIRLTAVEFTAPLHLFDGREVRAQVIVQPASAASGRCLIAAADASDDAKPWEAVFTAEYSIPAATHDDSPQPFPARDLAALPADFYESLAAQGYHYGPGYRWLHARGRGADANRFRLALEGAEPARGVPLHPGLLDGCFHAIALRAPPAGTDTVSLPRSIDRVDLAPARAPARHYVLELGTDAQHDLRLRDEHGHAVIALTNARFAPASRAALAALARAGARHAEAATGSVHAPSAPRAIEALLLESFDRALGAPFPRELADRPLAALGVDSLKAMELRGYLWRAFRRDIGLARLLSGISFTALLRELVDGAASLPSPGPDAQAVPADLDVISFEAPASEQPLEIEL